MTHRRSTERGQLAILWGSSPELNSMHSPSHTPTIHFCHAPFTLPDPHPTFLHTLHTLPLYILLAINVNKPHTQKLILVYLFIQLFSSRFAPHSLPDLILPYSSLSISLSITLQTLSNPPLPLHRFFKLLLANYYLYSSCVSPLPFESIIEVLVLSLHDSQNPYYTISRTNKSLTPIHSYPGPFSLLA